LNSAQETNVDPDKAAGAESTTSGGLTPNQVERDIPVVEGRFGSVAEVTIILVNRVPVGFELALVALSAVLDRLMLDAAGRVKSLVGELSEMLVVEGMKELSGSRSQSWSLWWFM